MGGGILVKSSKTGSDFSIIIKGLETHINENKIKEKKIEIIENKERVKILYADDNQMNLELLKAIAEAEGGEVIEANNGKEVLDILNSNDLPDIILLDVQMPILGGFETAKIIRRNSKFDKIPIFSLSVNTETKKNEFVNKQLTKPITKEQYRNEILNWKKGL